MENSSDKFIAIVGMSCRFAESPDIRGFWLNVLAAKPTFTEPSDASAERYLHEPASSFRLLPTLKAARLGDLWRGASPGKGALLSIDPEYALAAHLASAALKDAGGAAKSHNRTGLILAHSSAFEPSSVAWCQHGIVINQTMDLIRKCFPNGSPSDFETLKEALSDALPQYTSRNALTLLPHEIANAVAEWCGICGPAFCIDCGGASSAAAIQAGCDALAAGRIDLAVAGAVQGLVSPQLMMPFARAGVLAKSGEARSFRRDADGLLLGEGGGFLVLKRHADAIRDGDRIYAIVKNIAFSSDGNGPHPDGGYAEAIRAVWPANCQDVGTIDMLEANGSGVAATDRAELKTICSAMDEARPPRESIALGAVKSLVGDCLAAAGMASVIKATLSIYHRIIPPGLPESAFPRLLDLDDTPFYVATRPRPWVHNDAGSARRAGVASIGVAGEASFTVLEQVKR